MKKKIFVVALAACLLILSVAGSSMAYFTDTEAYTNVFTAGNVDITLTEAVTIRNDLGNIVADNTANDRIAYNADNVYNPLFPGQAIAKDPQIKNVGSEKAYVGAVITITNGDTKYGSTTTSGTIDEVLTADKNDATKTYVGDFITGLPANAVVTTIEEGGVVIGFKVYVVYAAALATNATADVFSGIKIPATWNNAEMAYVNGLKIDVNAYATQYAGFGDNAALTALQAAFPGVFPNP